MLIHLFTLSTDMSRFLNTDLVSCSRFGKRIIPVISKQKAGFTLNHVHYASSSDKTNETNKLTTLRLSRTITNIINYLHPQLRSLHSFRRMWNIHIINLLPQLFTNAAFRNQSICSSLFVDVSSRSFINPNENFTEPPLRYLSVHRRLMR